MDFFCPKNATVFDGDGFWPCYEHMLFGFGANAITIFILVVLAFSRRNGGGTGNLRSFQLERISLSIIAAIGGCLSVLDNVLLFIKNDSPGHGELFSRTSELIVWVVIMSATMSVYWISIVYNPFFCFWWVVKPLMCIPFLQTAFSSMEAVAIFRETSSFALEIVFGLFVNIARAVHAYDGVRKIASLEEQLLTDAEGGCDAVKNEFENNGYWCILTFKFANPMMDLGVSKQLDIDDLIPLPCDLSPYSSYKKLLRCWEEEERIQKASSSLFRVLCYAYVWPCVWLGLLKVLNDGLGFLSPLLLNKLIQFLQKGSKSLEGYALVIAMILVSTVKSFLGTQYSYHISKLRLRVRSSIMTIVYRKCLYTTLAERSRFSLGEVQTFMSVDVDRTVNLCSCFHDMWSLPLQIIVALYLLYIQVSFAFVSGIAIIILLIPVNKWIATLIVKATKEMMKHKDERIRSAAELITYIRTLKMYSWEPIFTSRLLEKRALEVKHLSTRKYLDAWCVFFWAVTPSLFSLFTFGGFTLMGHSLDAATVFTCLALFNMLNSPLNSFPWVINGLIDAIISTRRLSRFLSCPEHAVLRKFLSDPSFSNFESHNFTNDSSMGVAFYDVTGSWSSSSQEVQNIVLNGITLSLQKGLFVAVVGEVGSGKSSLVNSILGEMRITDGFIFRNGLIAYVPQVPWILSASVRENILCGEKFDSERYEEVVHSCALDVDISRMVGGDLSFIGEKGVNISGGQKARISLARAIYHDADIYLLDDVLSAVDSQVACWILEKVILNPLLKQKTRILCTHNLQAISSADMVVVMDKGCIRFLGSESSFKASSYSTISSVKDLYIFAETLHNEAAASTSLEMISDLQTENEGIEIVNESLEPEFRKEGRVELSIYAQYVKFASWPVAMLVCISAAIMQASRNGNDLWLSYWVDSTTGTEDTRFYLVVLCSFGILNSLSTLIRAFSFAFGGLRAAIALHSDLLEKIINAPIHFFDQNPSGRILNRLSSDMYTVDDSLPFILNILLNNVLVLMGIMIVLSYAQVFFLIIVIPLLYVYNKLQFYYRSTSRELRRLDSVYRSPIYLSFTETLDGSSTIRALRKEELFLGRFNDHIAQYQRTSYSELAASLWLSLRLQLLAALVIFFISLMAIVGGDFVTAGLAGLALSYAAPVVSSMSDFLTSFTETEKEMVSVERVLQYMDIPQEEVQGFQPLHSDWPTDGEIKFEHVTLKYMPSLPPALDDVTFRISPGTQVGIVGRTGAGKSSIINALFRLAEIRQGRILVDGMNVAGIGVRDLRSRFGVVPQSPFLFEGSLRDNLDPMKTATDSKIWECLEKCHVKGVVESVGGLDVHVKEGGQTFSVGQRQLICLARSLIKSSKVLCLDECTANVDTKTAWSLQKTLSTECDSVTVLTIAHRISMVLSMDSIFLLHNGHLVEQGSPQELLQDHHSRFSSFARASNM